MNLGSRRNQTQEVSTNSSKRKSEIVDLNSVVRTSVRRKSDAYHRVIDLEKPSISGDAVEAIGCSGFGNLANQNGKSQYGPCYISPENTTLAESLQLFRNRNTSRLSVGESTLDPVLTCFRTTWMQAGCWYLYDLFYDCTDCACICV